MSLKLCFKDKIHRISQTPPDFEALTATITTTYPNQLPPSWEVYYIDSEGDKISISHDQDYKDFLGSNPNNPSMSHKVYIVPADGEPLNPPVAPLHVAQKSHPQQEELKIEEVPKKADEKPEHFEDGEDDESRESFEEDISEISDKISQQSDDIRQQKDNIINSQNQREKAARADKRDSREERRQKIEARPRADPQPKNEGINNRVLNQAMDLLKKITRGDMSDAEMMQSFEKLSKFEEAMNPEQKEELRKKKEDIERRRARRESCLAANCPKEGEECKGEDMEESKSRRGKKENMRGSKREERIKDENKPERMKNSRRRDGERKPKSDKISKALDKILAAVEKGDTKRVNKCRDQALEKLSEEEKKALGPVFEMLAKGANADSLRKAIEEVEEKLDGSDQERDEKRGEELKNYSQEVKERAQKMKEILPGENIDKLCEYVAGAPEDMPVDVLVAAYNS